MLHLNVIVLFYCHARNPIAVFLFCFCSVLEMYLNLIHKNMVPMVTSICPSPHSDCIYICRCATVILISTDVYSKNRPSSKPLRCINNHLTI